MNTVAPFAVTAPNGSEVYTGGTSQLVTWNVAGSTANPISCANVKISMSIDGGWTYPLVLLATTPNDGSQAVVLPAVNTSSARIKVEAIGNIFFDISDADFAIYPPSTCGDVTGLVASPITPHTATLSWQPVPYANDYYVDYKPTDSNNWINIGNGITTTTLNLVGLDSIRSYDWRVMGNCSFGPANYTYAQFETPAPCPGPYDISTNGVISGAAQIPMNYPIMGKINVKGDIDYYKFVITNGGTITLTLTGLPTNYNLSLHNSIGTQLLISQNTGVLNETINATVAPGTYYAKVFGPNTFNATICYNLRVATGTASAMGMGGEEGMAIENQITGITVFPNPVIQTATVIVPGLEGKPDLIVYDMLGRQVMKQVAGSKMTSINVSMLPAGMYMLKLMNNGVELGSTKFIKN